MNKKSIPEELNRHRFIIGIGSQRAGSTLLHRLLEASSNVFMHPVKELHYFDTLYGYRSKESLQEFSIRQLVREVDRIVASSNLDFVKNKRYRCYLRTNRVLARSPIEKISYIDLFRPNLQNHHLFGEVTPEYMLLNEDSIIAMRQIVGGDACIMLICRNPVKRILSAVKLMNSYNNLEMDDVAANDWLRRMLESDNAWINAQDGYNDYVGAIERYSRHFPNFFAISYDALIEKPRLIAQEIADRFNLKIDEAMFEHEAKKTVNDLGSNYCITDELIADIDARYQHSRSCAEEHLGMKLTR